MLVQRRRGESDKSLAQRNRRAERVRYALLRGQKTYSTEDHPRPEMDWLAEQHYKFLVDRFAELMSGDVMSLVHKRRD